MKRISTALFAYGAFLILAGIVGFASNPEKAKTALISGGTFGLISLCLGVLALRGKAVAVPIAIGTAGFLSLTFIWRSTVSWIAFANGNSDKLPGAIIISAMLIASLSLLVFLLRAPRS